MKCLIILISISLLWDKAVSESCQTPLGRSSQCVSLYSCPQLVAVFEQNPIPKELVNFLRASQCGFEGNVPRVCCGPTPVIPTTQRPRSNSQPTYSKNVDPVVAEDSYPTSRDQCSVDNAGDKLYGGVNTELDEFNSMALLGYTPVNGGPLTYQCGGVLLNRRYILSAAHCVVGAIRTVVGTLTTARLGEYDTRTAVDCVGGTCADPVQEIPIQNAFPHPGYSDNNINRKDDISLLRLAQRVKYSYYVQPICLVDINSRVEAGTDLFVAGWGKTLSGKSSPVKQKLALPVHSKRDCIAKYSSLGAEITDKQLCAGGNFAEDACKGDSGGPLMRRTASGIWETVAVVSFGYGCGRDGWPGIYTSVAGYLDWIQDTMRSSNV